MSENIKFLVRPNSSENSVTGIYDDKIKVKINASPEKGKANKELIDFLSNKLKVPKQDIEIIRGKFSNIKEVKIKNKSKSSVITCLLNGAS
ncbi:MAG: DUF167 domain-containing protein [Actinomycetota bacterium]|nr:DUF167 domain-containing protein [Actinomycetota bacterium]